MSQSQPRYRYIVQGYRRETTDQPPQLLDAVMIDIFAESEKHALARARGLVKKEHYRVHTVIEQDHPPIDFVPSRLEVVA